MDMSQKAEKLRLAPEIAVTLAGRRFALFGFDAEQTARISAALRQADCLSTPFEETWLGESARLGDGFLIKITSLSARALRAAAASTVPVLIVGAAESVLEGAAGAYAWAHDFLGEPWSDAELVARLFRLIAAPRDYASLAADRARPQILLADDDPSWISLAEATLRSHGLVCHTATDGLNALRLARQLLPDVIVLDVKMPRMDGFEVLETIRREPLLEALPVALLTGCDDTQEVSRGAELGADDYLVKPLSPTVLLNRVKRLLSAAPSRVHPVAPDAVNGG